MFTPRFLLLGIGFAASLTAPGAWAQSKAASVESITRKMNAIIIPAVEFRATTLADAVEFLRQESRRLDSTRDAAERGVNILLRAPAGASANRTPITLTLTRIPLLEALRYVAAQAALKVKVEPYAVSLVPVGEPTEALIMRTFVVQPDFFGSVSGVKAGAEHSLGGTQ